MIFKELLICCSPNCKKLLRELVYRLIINVVDIKTVCVITFQENAVEECTEVLVALAQRGSAVLDPKSSWLPILQCLLSLKSHGIVKLKCSLFVLFDSKYLIKCLDHLRKVLDNSDLNLATEMHLLLNSSTGTVGHFRNLIMGKNLVIV